MLFACLPAQAQVSRHATAAVTVFVNGLTRQGTAIDGTLSTVRDALSTLCRLVAVYSVPFRQHEMTVVEIIIAVLHCPTDGVLACLHCCMISYDIWTPR